MNRVFITVILVFLVSLDGFSQQTKTQHEHFKLNNRVLIWQKVYETDKTINEVFQYFKKQPLTKDIELVDGSLVGTSSLTKASSRKGYSWVFSDFTTFITIDNKEGRYRVTLKDFKYKPVETSVSSGGLGISSPVSTTLSQSFVRSNYNEIRKNKSSRNYLTVLNTDLVNAFKIKEVEKTNDW
jgi:hypothetical protein